MKSTKNNILDELNGSIKTADTEFAYKESMDDKIMVIGTLLVIVVLVGIFIQVIGKHIRRLTQAGRDKDISIRLRYEFDTKKDVLEEVYIMGLKPSEERIKKVEEGKGETVVIVEMPLKNLRLVVETEEIRNRRIRSLKTLKKMYIDIEDYLKKEVRISETDHKGMRQAINLIESNIKHILSQSDRFEKRDIKALEEKRDRIGKCLSYSGLEGINTLEKEFNQLIDELRNRAEEETKDAPSKESTELYDPDPE